MQHSSGYVLVLEDDEHIADLMGAILEMDNIPYKIARTCAEAEKIARWFPPRVVLFDYVLDGETCEHLMKNGHFFGAPVYLVTAAAQPEALAQRLKSGLLKKPFNIENLTDLVRSHFTRAIPSL